MIIDLEREEDGRWIAEIPALPGAWRAPSHREVNAEADRYTLDMFFGEGRPWWFNVLRLKAVSMMTPEFRRALKKRMAGK